MEQTFSESLKYAQLPNKETYAYRDLGSSSNKTLILLHGNLTTSLFLDLFANEMVKNYRIIAPDMRGYGHTTYNTPISSIEDLCEDLKLFLDVIEISKCYLLGWSAGGPVAQLFASKYPSMVEKLILVASVGPQGPMMCDHNQRLMREKKDFLNCWNMKGLTSMLNAKNKSTLRAFLEFGAFQGRGLPSQERLDAYVEEIMMQRNVVDMCFALNKFNISNESNGICQGSGQIRNIQGPCLLIHGSDDVNVELATTWKIQKLLGAKAEMEIIKSAGHFLFEKNEVKNVAELVKKFLNKRKNSEPKILFATE